jgi:hypothetical protein
MLVVSATEPEIQWVTICEANSWDGFKQALQAAGGYVPSGKRVKLEITSTLPIAPLFDLMGAEFIANLTYDLSQVGAELLDVYGDGWFKIVIMMRSVYLPPQATQVFPAIAPLTALAIGALAGVLIRLLGPIIIDWLTSGFGLYAEEWVQEAPPDYSNLIMLMVVLMMMGMIVPMMGED